MAHQSFMQDPMIAQTMGQNPMAQQMMASLQAHIAEHLAFKYRKQIEERLGVTLPAPNEELPEEIEVQLARLVADAGQQLTQIHQQEAAQQKAQQQQQDPLFQLQQAEVQIKQSDVQRKAEKDKADIALAAAKLELEKQKVGVSAENEANRLAIQGKQAVDKHKMDFLKTYMSSNKQGN
jgi:hypothetical protein